MQEMRVMGNHPEDFVDRAARELSGDDLAITVTWRTRMSDQDRRDFAWYVEAKYADDLAHMFSAFLLFKDEVQQRRARMEGWG